ncbi:ABC transporter ATP-binding protein [Nevskia sp.]|uniref:ABC transporter ATP-binding protein n=1 Tax=Nevskia sp. TaxID=1929292 RepID=UPI0025F82449|nr:ABC transporter ATP-binding protein [Nevskia sp.]
MDNPILMEAQGLTRRYGNNVAANNVNLTLRKGEILGLLGPNGAGKSTTMKMLAGVLAPTEGHVTINGVSLADDPRGAKKSLGYLPEQPPVYPELTVDEYLRYAAGLHGVRKSDLKDALASAKASCGLNEMAKRLIGNLSKGYQQRVGIAQAIIHRPAVVILDEPTVGLDPIQILEIRKLIKELGEQHSVILSSHILPEIQAVCARVMIIHRGRVVYSEPLAAAGTEGFKTVLVGFTNPPKAAALAALPGVAKVEPAPRQHFRVHVVGTADPRAAIAAAADAGGWGLIELHAQVRTLEEIFVELTLGEVLHTEAAAPTQEAA